MKNPLKIFVLVLIILLAVSDTYAAFDESPGKRISALGGAGVADAGDPMGFYYNPAASAWGKLTAFETQYGRLFWGLEGDKLSRTALGGFYFLGDWGSVSLGYDQFGSDLYAEQRTLVAYSQKFSFPIGKMSFGAGLNLLNRTYEENEYTLIDPLFNEYGYQKSSVAIDLGCQWIVNNRLSLGLAVLRVNRPNQAFEEGIKDPLPRQYSLGAVYNLNSYYIHTDFEYRDRAIGSADINPRLGVEKKLFLDKLALRIGGNRDNLAFGLGLNFYSNESGKSYARPTSTGKTEKINENKILKLGVGYTFQYPIGGIKETAGNHLFGLTVNFDRLMKITGTEYLEPKQESTQIIYQTDTVKVYEPRFVRVEIEDSSKIESLKEQLRDMKAEVEALLELNKAQRYLELALKQYYQKKYTDALGSCDKARELIPGLALSYIRKGSIYYAMGRYEEARRDWEEALRLEPGDEEVIKYLKSISP